MPDKDERDRSVGQPSGQHVPASVAARLMAFARGIVAPADKDRTDGNDRGA